MSVDWNYLNFPLTNIHIYEPLHSYISSLPDVVVKVPFLLSGPNFTLYSGSYPLPPFQKTCPFVCPSLLYLFTLTCPARYSRETCSVLSSTFKKNLLTLHFILSTVLSLLPFTVILLFRNYLPLMSPFPYLLCIL